jgi:suppressor of G2 allele of SKP1
MSSSDATKGQQALQNSDYPAAVKYLTLAISSTTSTPSPLWLIQRSTAYQRTSQHALALADADNALLAAIKRGKRDLMATAHFRRAVALHGLKRYGDARLCLHWCGKLNEKEKGLTIWIAKVKNDFDNAGGDDAECNQTTVKETPDPVEEVKSGAQDEVEEKKVSKGKGKEKEKNGAVTATPTPAAAPAQTPKEKVRHEWYQSPSTVTIEIFAKGIPKDQAEVIIAEGSVRISLPSPYHQTNRSQLEVSFPIAASNSTYDYTVQPLFSPVDILKSSFRITPHKIEIILQKAKPGLKWSSLEGTEPIASTDTSTSAPSKIPAEILAPKQDSAPAYPTSSRTGPKNWDKLVGDKDDDDEGGVDDFFKKLYANADPDTKRAMMKSYQESNGTSLSTVWDEVGKKKVETSPPEGMEAKTWEI